MNKKWMIGIIGMTSLALVSCGGTSSSSGSSSANSGLSIPGKVTSDSNSSSSLGFQKLTLSQKVGKFALSGCQVKALSLSDSSELASATSDQNGNYILNSESLKEGENYKISASCAGGNNFVSVGKAVNKPADEITDEDRVATNPRSTIISAFIIKAVVEAISEAVASIGDPVVKNTVKEAIFVSMDAIISSIQSNVKEAIESGAMPEPTPADANAVGPAVIAADPNTSSNGIDSSLTNASVETPASVNQAIDGAKSSVSSLGACHSTGGSLNKCIRAMAKVMHNTLNFNILIAKTGAFGQDSTISSCSAAHVVDSSVSPSLTLADIFATSDVVEASGVITGLTDYCMVVSKRTAVNRNQGYEDGGDDNGPVFAETGDLDGVTGDEVGMITAIGTAMFSGNTYNLQSLNDFVFDHQNGAGMNGRMVNKRRTPNSGVDYYYLEAGAWQDAGWPQDGGGNDKSPHDLDITFGSLYDWASVSGTDASAAGKIAASVFNGQRVFHQLFGGDIPTQEELDSHIDEDKVHEQHNITGPKELYVLTNGFPGPGNSATGANPCFDNDPLTNCKDETGNDLAPVSVDITLGSANADGIKKITSMDGTGASYFLRPMYSHQGFNGVMGLIKASDGKMARDELFQQRAVKVVLDQASECNSNGLPTTGAGCADGNIYNATLDWSQCDGGSQCPGYTASDLVSASGVSIVVQDHYNHVFENNHRLLAIGFDGNREKIKVTLTPGSGDDVVVFAGLGAAGSGEYNLAIYDDCSSICTFQGFVLIDDTGAPYTGDSDPTLSNINYKSSTGVNLYSKAHVNSGNDFDPNTGATTIDDVAVHRNINNGPVPSQSHRCENEPFFVDGNNNGQLDCQVQSISFNGTVMQLSLPAAGDVSFSDPWEHERWMNDPSLQPGEIAARQSMPLIARDNAYFYEDPIGTKSLLSLAFNGWFDGAHSLEDNTELDALQAFALTFLFFTGDDEKHLDDLNNPQHNKFEAVLPMDFASDQDFLKSLNESLGKAFSEFKTN